MGENEPRTFKVVYRDDRNPHRERRTSRVVRSDDRDLTPEQAAEAYYLRRAEELIREAGLEHLLECSEEDDSP